MILILGYPGQGKSSFCKKILNQYILKEKQRVKDIYYFALRNIRQVKDFMFNPLKTLYEEACFDTEQELNKYDFYKSVLVLDGLDELYMREGLKLEEIDKLCKELAFLTERNTELQIVLTSRYGYVDLEKIFKEKICIVQLELFSLELQKKWLANYTVYHPETWLTDEKLMVFNSEKKYEHLKELIEQPLLIYMIASIQEEIDEHTNRAKIYSKLFTELIDRKYSKDGQLEIFRSIGKEDLRELIREIAFGIFLTGNEYITKYELMKLNASQQFFRKLPEENLKDSIKGIMISFYFKEVEKKLGEDDFNDKSNYAVEFLHKSLREYLTAEKIYTTIKTEFLDKRSSGRYVIDDSNSALKVIYSIFNKEKMSDEITSHLEEIISNDDKSNKEELLDRLFYFFGEMLKSDFILNYQFDEFSNPVRKSFLCFYGFWFLVSCLGIEKNYLVNPEIQERFCEYIHLLSNTLSGVGVNNLDFSYQTFGHLSFNACVFDSCRFVNTVFYNVDFADSIFHFCLFSGKSNRSSVFQSVRFFNCRLDNLLYDECVFNECKFVNPVLENVEFDKCKIYGTGFSIHDNLRESSVFNKIVLTDTEMDQNSNDAFLKCHPESILVNIKIFTGFFGELPDFVTEEEVKGVEISDNYKRIL